MTDEQRESLLVSVATAVFWVVRLAEIHEQDAGRKGVLGGWERLRLSEAVIDLGKELNGIAPFKDVDK